MANMVQNSIFAHKVFDDIGNREYKYVYFDGYWTDNQQQEHVAYEDQQGVLDSEWKSAVGETNHSDIAGGLAALKGHFQLLKADAENKEQALLATMKYNGAYKNLPDNEKVKLWTRLFLFGSKGNKRMWDVGNSRDVEIAFALFINSKEFITRYRSSAIYSVLKSTEYGKALGKDMSIEGSKASVRKEFVDMLTNYRNSKYSNFRQAVVNSMEDYFVDTGITSNYIQNIVTDAFRQTRDFTNTYKQTAAKRNINENTVYENVKKNLKTSMEAMLHSAYEEVKKTMGKSAYEEWEKSKIVDDVLSSLKINLGTEENPYIVMEITPATKTDGAYKSQRGASPQQKKDSFIAAVQMLANDMRNSRISLGFIQNMTLGSPTFWNCVDAFVKNRLKAVTDAIFGPNSSFFTQDWNASAMTGMLGELSTYLTHGNLSGLSLTGTTIDKVMYDGKSISLGESFRDLSFNDGQYGINVKRYTTQEKDSFTLYSDNEGVGINSQYMYRYFTPDEVNLIRFVALNRDFIVKNLSTAGEGEADRMMIDLYQSLSLSRIDNFIRLSSMADKSINLLYVINNLTIPASVIYNYILKTLNDLNKAKTLFNIQINNTPNASRIDISDSQSIADLPANVSESNNLLRDSIKIKFKGLTLTGLGRIFK